MPKKFGTNTKSQEARERKETAKELQKSKKAQAEEDEKWADNDVLINRKLQRKVMKSICWFLSGWKRSQTPRSYQKEAGEQKTSRRGNEQSPKCKDQKSTLQRQ